MGAFNSGRNTNIYTYDNYLRLISMLVTMTNENAHGLSVKIMAKINIIDVELCSIYNRVRGTMFGNWFRSLNNSYPHYDNKNNYRVSFFFLENGKFTIFNGTLNFFLTKIFGNIFHTFIFYSFERNLWNRKNFDRSYPKFKKKNY